MQCGKSKRGNKAKGVEEVEEKRRYLGMWRKEKVAQGHWNREAERHRRRMGTEGRRRTTKVSNRKVKKGVVK